MTTKIEKCGWCGRDWMRAREVHGGRYVACSTHEYLLPPPGGGRDEVRAVKMVPTQRGMTEGAV